MYSTFFRGAIYDDGFGYALHLYEVQQHIFSAVVASYSAIGGGSGVVASCSATGGISGVDASCLQAPSACYCGPYVQASNEDN